MISSLQISLSLRIATSAHWPRSPNGGTAPYSRFSIQAALRHLEDLAGFVVASQEAGGDSEVAFGHLGHGVNGWWLCYRLNRDALAVYRHLG